MDAEGEGVSFDTDEVIKSMQRNGGFDAPAAQFEEVEPPPGDEDGDEDDEDEGENGPRRRRKRR